MSKKLHEEVLGLSAGTMSSLIGLNQYWAIEKVQDTFYYYCNKIQEEITWIEAWKEFKCSDEYRDILWDIVDEFAESIEEYSDWTVKTSFDGYKIEKVELVEDEEMNNQKIKIENIMETTYENNTCWIEYLFDGKLGYEILEGNAEEVREKIENGEISADKMKCKRSIFQCRNDLRNWIEDCRQSENEMWYVEFEDLQEDLGTTEEDIMDNFLLELQEEIIALDIQDYITFKEDDCAITIYGGVITKFLF